MNGNEREVKGNSKGNEKENERTCKKLKEHARNVKGNEWRAKEHRAPNEVNKSNVYLGLPSIIRISAAF